MRQEKKMKGDCQEAGSQQLLVNKGPKGQGFRAVCHPRGSLLDL